MLKNIDFVKGLAIIGVIAVHTLPEGLVKKYQLDFTLNQQVSIFIMISTILSIISFEKKSFRLTISGYFNYIKRKLVGLMIPIGVIFFISCIGYYIAKIKGNGFSYDTLFFRFPIEGPGNYYILLLIQFICIMPFIKSLYSKKPNFTLIILVILNFLMEIIFWKSSIFKNYFFYKACILRYFGAIAVGIILYEVIKLKKTKSIKFLMLMIISPISFYYIYLGSNTGFRIDWIYSRSWYQQNIFTFAYSGILLYLLLRYVRGKGLFYNTISNLGNISLYIFLVQIIYFSFGFSFYDDVLKQKTILPNIFVYLIAIIMDLFICFSLAKVLKAFEKKIKLLGGSIL